MESSIFTFKKVLMLFALLLFVIFIYQWASSPMVITVVGSGEVSATAENVTVTFSIGGKGDTASSALSDLNSRKEKIREALKNLSVLESDIYEQQATVYPSSLAVSGASGFTASASMGFKTVLVNNVDSLTSTLYTLGASVVSQPILSIKDKDTLDQKAYDLALKDAKSKANRIGNRNLKFLKKIILVQESQQNPTSTVTSKPDTVTQIDYNIAAETGVIKVQKLLSVSYKMW